MHQLKIRIKLDSPVVISSQSGDSTLTQTLTYIPGTTMLGLLAGRYLKSFGKSGSFSRIFLRGDVHFRNLYPVKGSRTFLPCPANIWRSKTNPASFANMLAGSGENDDYKKLDAFASISGEYVDIHTPVKEIFFHHERDYAKGISKTGVVFNYEALASGQEFVGLIQGSEDDIATLKELLEQDPTLRIGKSKTSQYGNASLTGCESTPFTIVENNGLEGRLLVMASDTIIKNSAGISTINLADLETYLGVKIISASIDTTRIETIVNAHKAKKPSEAAFKAGSSFLLENTPSGAEDLVRHGLGERTWEGFGQVCLLDELPDNLRLLSSENTEYSRPETPPPNLIKSLADGLRAQAVNTLLSRKAEEIAELIGPRRLSNSLLGRLESFAGSGNFSQSFAQLRDLSMQKIRKIHIGNQSFDDYLGRIDEEIMSMINSAEAMNLGRNKKLRDLVSETGLAPLRAENLKSNYLKTLFLSIRRINNKNREAE